MMTSSGYQPRQRVVPARSTHAACRPSWEPRCPPSIHAAQCPGWNAHSRHKPKAAKSTSAKLHEFSINQVLKFLHILWTCRFSIGHG